MSKQLLIEEAEFTTPIKIEKGLKESISVENNNDVLIVRNIPATIADRKNQNGRIYTTEVLQEAIRNANFQLKTKWMYSQADEHPEGSFVKPSHASHVVINAYIKKNVKVFVEGKTERHNVMFMDWEILNTEEGKNLKALILQETACPTSIRGLGDMEGEYVTNYELLGCDVVSNPSSGTSMRMPVSESIKVESSDKSYLDESFEVVTVSNDVVSDVEAAAQKQVDIENARYGTITNIKTKLDQEIDPKTHAETTITSIEATTTDEVSELNQALQMAQNAFANPVSKMDSVTITYIDDAEKAKESTVASAPSTKELEEKDTQKEFLNANATCGDVNVIGSMTKDSENGDKKDDGILPDISSLVSSKEQVEPKKEFLDANATCGDVNVFGFMKKDSDNQKEESGNETTDQTLINGLEVAVKELNDQIIKEKDPEKIKKLKMNRDELEKLLNKNKESQVKSDEEAKKEFLDFGTTQVNGNNAEVISNDKKDPEDDQEIKEELDKKQSNIEVKGNKLSVQLDQNTTLEKELDSEKDAQIAKAGLDSGKIDPNFMVTEDYSGFKTTQNDDGTTTYSCDGTATYDYNTGDFSCGEGTQNEKLYSNPDEPSDALVNQPLNDSNKDIINVTLTDIDYDISDPENISAEDEQYLSELPHEVTTSLQIDTLPEEGEVDKYIIASAAEQTGLPIKNAKIKSVSVDLLNQPKEESALEETPLWGIGANIRDFGAGIAKNIKKNWEAADKDVSKDQIWDATIKGKNNFLQGCIDHGVKLNIIQNGITPLMYAATKGMIDTINVLAQDKKLLNAQNRDGNTALILAAAYANDDQAVEALLQNGADPTIANKNGKTIYDYAQKKPDIMNVLQQNQNTEDDNSDEGLNFTSGNSQQSQTNFKNSLNKLQTMLNSALKLSAELTQQQNGMKDSVMTEEGSEGDTFNVYAFFDGQLKDNASDITSEEEAIQKAEAFKQQYENAGTNFQVIVTRVNNGFEDYDKLVYQYPDVEIADDDLTDESIKEYTTEEPEEVFDFVNHKDIPDRTLLKDASGSTIQVFSNGDYNVDGNLDWTPEPGQLIDDLTNNGYKIVGAWVNNKQIYSSEQ